MKTPSFFLLIASILLIIISPILLYLTAVIGFVLTFVDHVMEAMIFIPLLALSPRMFYISARIEFIYPTLEVLSRFTIFFFPIIIFVVLLVASLMGILSWKRPHRAKYCILLGIILLASNAILSILLIITQNLAGGGFLFILIMNSVIPTGYIVAANELRKSQNLANVNKTTPQEADSSHSTL